MGKNIYGNKLISIQPYAEQHVEAVRCFNDRLHAGGIDAQFPLSPTPAWLPKIAGRDIYQEYHLAVENDDAVRGGYVLKHQSFWIKDQVVPIADYRLPISEGTVDSRFPQIAVMLLRDALGKQPLLFGLGMGGYEEPLTRLLKAAGWHMFSVPFFFRVIHPTAFLRNISLLRRSAARRLALNIAALTGTGWLGVHALQALRGRNTVPLKNIKSEPVTEFDDWADTLWDSCKARYGMSAVRDAETLRILYPVDDERFIRLKVKHGTRTIGWAVLIVSQLSGHKHFGDMRLGSIVDCFASVEDAPAVAAAARRRLQSRGVDLIVSNQSHAAWQRGFQQAGFLRGPSNFIFASSPELTKILHDKKIEDHDLHFNRGDGDGPINL